jgi:CheY-like chemotaxis protein
MVEKDLINIMQIKVLLIEDNPVDALLVEDALIEIETVKFELHPTERISKGIDYLAENHVDLILLDLSLPDSAGIDTVLQIRESAPDIPCIVLTGSKDEDLGVKAIQYGMQDYLVKDQLESNLLLRSIIYSIERHRLLGELEHERQIEQTEKEFRLLKEFPGALQVSVTAQIFGSIPLRKLHQGIFSEYVKRFEHIIEQQLDQFTYKVQYNISEELRSIVEDIGFIKANPRDLIDIYTLALRNKIKDVTPQKALAYIKESRMLLLELMGYLTSYYRNRAFSNYGELT